VTFPTRVGTDSGANSGGTTSCVVTVNASTAIGDLVLVVTSSNDIDFTAPAGWTQLVANVDTGTLRTGVWWRVRQSGDTSYTFTNGGSGFARWASFTLRNANSALIVTGAGQDRATSGGTFSNIAPALTTVSADNTVLTISTERTSAAEAGVSSVSSGTQWLWAGHSGGIETIFVAYTEQSTAGSAPAVTVTYPNTQAANGYALQIAFPPSAPAPTFTTRYAARIRKTASAFAAWAPQRRLGIFTVANWAAGSRRVAHRGGGIQGTVWPEETLPAYARCEALGWRCLEVSLQRTSDGHFVASHDSTTNRIFVTNYTIASTTRATLTGLVAKTVGAYSGETIAFLDQILDAYGGRVVLFLDDKTNANGAALRAQIEAHATAHGYDPHQFFVWKGYKGWITEARLWLAAGYTAWGIYYAPPAVGSNEMTSGGGSPSFYVDEFTYLGLNFDSTGTDWTNANAQAATYGRTVMSHVVLSPTDLATGAGNGAVGAMCADVVNITP
jgi:Glycerophosphoryl diester phosphodiesterase family